MGNKKIMILIGVLISVIIILSIVIVFFDTLKSTLFAENTVPEITLMLLRGPELDDESGKYLYEVEARVTGNPKPVVTFNRYDNLEEVGANIITIFLQAGERFVLEAVAENRAGKAAARLMLIAEITEDNGDTESTADTKPTSTPAENMPPVISEIVFFHELLKPSTSYELTAITSDPDGDELIHQWDVSGGTISYYNCNSISWTTPSSPGDYEVTVAVNDGKGGETVKSITVPVGYLYSNPIPEHSGHIIKDQQVNMPSKIRAGDSISNRTVRGFVSFDIGMLDDFTIQTAELRLANPHVAGDPTFMHGTSGIIGLRILVVRMPWESFTLAQFDTPAYMIAGYTNYDITHLSVAGDGLNIVKYLQEAIDQGHQRFIFRLQFTEEVTNNNSKRDDVSYDSESISLYLTFGSGGP